MLSDMSHGVSYHQCQQQHSRQREAEAIQIIIEFTFRDMPHFISYQLSVISFQLRSHLRSHRLVFSYQPTVIR